MHRNGIVIEGWYPFGGRGYTKAMFSNETLKEIAEAHGKSPAQIILRWDLQHGVAVIPGSSNPDHQKENISVLKWHASTRSTGTRNMTGIDNLNNRRI